MTNNKFGLIGKNIQYSFSKKYFTDKFRNKSIGNCTYENFDIETIDLFEKIIKDNPDIKGLNVTIPYKESIIPFLDKLSKKAELIGAVNVIKFTSKGKLKGYNSDYYGFKKSLKSHLKEHHKKAMILGTGGASKAIAFALKQLDIEYIFVSRNTETNTLTYNQIDQSVFENYQIIVNCTPLGTSPNINESPPLPYDFFNENHIAFDLIYNPEETVFLRKAREKGAITINGYEMLIHQAEKAWKIWNK